MPSTKRPGLKGLEPKTFKKTQKRGLADKKANLDEKRIFGKHYLDVSYR